MKFERLNYWFVVGLVPFVMSLTACNNDIENEPKDQPMVNQRYEAQMSQLDSEVNRLDKNWDTQSTTIKLSQETNSKVKDYLDELYANINSTRAEHLPEWQKMFDVLTLPEALEDPNMTLGTELRTNNLYRHDVKIKEQGAQLEKNTQTITDHSAIIAEQAKLIAEQRQHLDTMRDQIVELNRIVDSKHAAISAEVASYKEKVVIMEGRVKTVEVGFNDLQRDLGSKVNDFKAILDGVQRLLDSFPLATMWSDTQRLNKTVFQDHQPRLTDAEKKLSTAASDITTLQSKQTIQGDDLTSLNDAFKIVAADFRVFKGTDFPVFEDKVNSLEGLVNDPANGLVAVGTNVQDMNLQLDVVANEAVNATSSIEVLKTQIEELKKKLDELIQP